MSDLLLTGGRLVVPGLPALQADLLIDYDEPLRRRGGVVTDIGDLAWREARDTVDLSGLHVLPLDAALDRAHGPQIQPGAPARFVVARDAAGREPLWRFEGEPPPEWRVAGTPAAGEGEPR